MKYWNRLIKISKIVLAFSLLMILTSLPGCNNNDQVAVQDGNQQETPWEWETASIVTFVRDFDNDHNYVSGEQLFVPATSEQQEMFKDALFKILGRDYAVADIFNEFNYTLRLIIDPDVNRRFAVIVEQEPFEWGRGLFVINLSQANPLVIEVAHRNFETYVAAQGVEMLKDLNAKALLLNGAHRCDQPLASGCDGNTSACGANGSYRISDAAHSMPTLFQIAHEVLFDQLPDSVAISVHGFAWDGTEPVAYISDGTELKNDSSISVVFKTELNALLPDPYTAVSCNDSKDSGIARLCGSSNVQGRYSNLSIDPCNTEASEAHDRFLHLEQSIELRRSSGEINRGMVIEALQEVLRK